MASILWRPPGRLYFLTMDEAPVDPIQQVEAACDAGIRWIQLRMKLAPDEEVLEVARAAKKICMERDCVLIINDRVAVAAESGADGVHLGKQDMSTAEARRLLGEGRIIGGTANTIEDIREHWRQGADYIGLGPCRYTTTKKNLSPILGLAGYQRILGQMRREQIPLPVVAIGGIGMEDVAPLLDAGLHGIAFSGMLVRAEDRPGLVRLLDETIKNY
ncbi:thiamine phosphate synthase [Puia sp.]|uniref:thiamine phosphate synthase n=1 Tax=Puia sp. TaxID=2045100 RepID=UPI002F3EB540